MRPDSAEPSDEYSGGCDRGGAPDRGPSPTGPDPGICDDAVTSTSSTFLLSLHFLILKVSLEVVMVQADYMRKKK